VLHTQCKQQQQWEVSVDWALQHTFKEEIKMCSSKTFHLTPVFKAGQSPGINTAHYWFLRPSITECFQQEGEFTASLNCCGR
jgi:hypothetical protein